METIKIGVEAKSTLPHTALEPFQGDLKRLPKEQYEKLRKSIIDHGFSFSVHVWQHEGHNYIIDGHQRVFTVTQMALNEGWEIPELPISFVKAESFADAKRKVLAGASQYGQVTDAGLLEFLKANDIPYDNIVATYSFPEIDFGDFAEKHMKIEEVPTLPPPGEDLPPEMKSGSDQVKQIQLFFNAELHHEFMTTVEALAKIYGTQNVTDTVMEALRADYKSKHPVAQ